MKDNIVYKGSERRVIVVKSSMGKHFEEAHFYLKTGEETLPSMPDLLNEANRIVEASLLPSHTKKRIERRRWFGRGFGSGMLAAALLGAGLCLLGRLLGWL